MPEHTNGVPLTEGCPDVLKYWDYSMNTEKPEDISIKSHKKIQWVCPEGHKWIATVSNVTKGSRCPYCSGRYAITGKNDLATVNPELAKQWHPTKNGDLKPSDVTPGSTKKVWWIGECGHEWDSMVFCRNRGDGCPYCRRLKILQGFNDLASTYPSIAKEWHPTKNGELQPTNITYGSSKEVWWIDNLGHEWRAPPKDRVRGRGCPICAGRKLLVGYNDLETLYPEIASEWNYEKNGDSKPTDCAGMSNKSVWWKCKDCGYEWKTCICYRTSGRTGCPKCDSDYKTSFGEKAISYYVSQIVNIEENYKAPFLGKMELDIFIPSLKIAIEYDGGHWHKSDERDKKKNDICAKNGIEVIRVREDDREIEGSFNIHILYWNTNSLEGGIKSVCEIVAKRLNVSIPNVDVNRDTSAIIQKKYQSRKMNSIAFKLPELCNEWDYEKNDNLKPDTVPFKSNMKVWWKCNNGHSWQAPPCSRAVGNGCPYCYKERMKRKTHPDLSLH